MELNYGLDAVATVGAAPSSLGQPASVKVWIDGNVITKALGRSEQRLQFDLLYGSLAFLAASYLVDGIKDLIVRERRELFRDIWEPLEHLERFDGVNCLQKVPEFPNGRIHCRPSVRQR